MNKICKNCKYYLLDKEDGYWCSNEFSVWYTNLIWEDNECNLFEVKENEI